MGRGAWWATVHGVTKNQTRLKRLSMHSTVHLRQRHSLRPCGLCSHFKDLIKTVIALISLLGVLLFSWCQYFEKLSR